MKRDLAALAFGLCLMIVSGLLAVETVTPAFAPVGSTTPVLILDAGHGGEDGGALSAAGHKESDINLAIVLKMEQLMAFLGIEPVLIRDKDISIYDAGCNTLREKKISDLKNRVKLIQSIPNAALISVHQNAFTNSKYQGAQVFFGRGDLSRQWGLCTQTAISAYLDRDNTRKAGGVPDHVYLFKHIDCPAILVECGFLSNGEEVSLLLTDSYQRKISVTLTGAYMQFMQMIPQPLGGD